MNLNIAYHIHFLHSMMKLPTNKLNSSSVLIYSRSLLWIRFRRGWLFVLSSRTGHFARPSLPIILQNEWSWTSMDNSNMMASALPCLACQSFVCDAHGLCQGKIFILETWLGRKSSVFVTAGIVVLFLCHCCYLICFSVRIELLSVNYLIILWPCCVISQIC